MYLLLVKSRSMSEPFPLKQIFPLIKFIKPMTLKKSFMALSRYQALKSTITIKLSYALEKKSFILVKSPRNLESESAKCGLHIDLTNQFPLLRLSSKGKV